MILLILLVTGAVTLFVHTANSSKLRTEQDSKTSSALAQAKEALIGRSAADSNRPGSLPCPDTNNDGSSELFVGNNCPSYIGRLPWRTLGLPDLRDAYGERLWYALSSNLRDDSSAQPINSNTIGQLTITGSIPASQIIAIIFSAGPPLSGQVRDNTNEHNAVNYNVANFLEGDNATTGDNSFITAASSNTFNDQLLTISNGQLFPIVEKRVAKEVITQLKTYYAATGNYPFAANLSGVSPLATNCSTSNTTGRLPLSGANCSSLIWPSWLTNNNWNDVIYYARGSLSVGSTSGVQVLIVMDGRPLSNTLCNGLPKTQQTRPSLDICDYLDSTENTNGNSAYSSATLSATYNDQVFIVAP